MTLDELLEALEKHPPEAALMFSADGIPVHGGYHVTEFSQAEVKSMDCGGREDAWSEARLQILDGQGADRAAMPVGKFRAIAARVVTALPGISALPLKVELAPDNHGLHIYEAGAPIAAGGAVVVPLMSGRAMCKPAHQALGGTASCCGAPAACC